MLTILKIIGCVALFWIGAIILKLCFAKPRSTEGGE
jgi:hypothetical protein